MRWTRQRQARLKREGVALFSSGRRDLRMFALTAALRVVR
jgi:hypothetical protein